MMDFDCANPIGPPTEFSDVAFNARIAINHPAEPVMVFFSDGSFEWAFDGDVEYMGTMCLGTSRRLINAVSVDSVLSALHGFIQQNPVNG